MANVRMVARRAFAFRGRAVLSGERFEVPALDAAILHYRRRADFAPRAPRKLDPPPPIPVVDAELDPPTVRRPVDAVPVVPTLDEVAEVPKASPPSRNPRHTRRRDLEPEP